MLPQKSLPDEAQQAALFARCATPEPVIAHGEAVARCALVLSRRLPCPVDTALLLSACRLHDIARTCPNHPQAGAEILRQAGYALLADIVAQHHDLLPGASKEACLLYLADKLVKGTQPVSLRQRFETSRQKCRTPEAVAAWETRWEQTHQVIETLQLRLAENEVIL